MEGLDKNLSLMLKSGTKVHCNGSLKFMLHYSLEIVLWLNFGIPGHRNIPTAKSGKCTVHTKICGKVHNSEIVPLMFLYQIKQKTRRGSRIEVYKAE